ncbi:DNA-binding response regulator, LytR/AlgR family [Arenibacter palladensis]|uniref:DNA-binding response regulator, LytR/AlgR family n=1 Tax=Arenibacter palladensis TaxID=237373 RepID=A0A1M5F577_9FLAO|nr:LytTR family DNA-binding domain-containing protein [Arenibacter palladensis]MDO6605628.1 LytTR family DNA-binding domain-containing protein [Arenibacter palladensis]SHF86699.1 DNA-binding response regulator, LytR/AlgR family [Arenibacter palladensis]|tara:strand:+ start:9929 stop:10693 length:765 start_codon:yes stop_codon:yes gene_type:complete
MKILLVEDEDLAVKKLRKTLEAVDPGIEVIGTTDSIKATVQWLKDNPAPELILMDIELADGQSFEIFNLIDVNGPVIFTTSYDEFALKAFKVNSVDYLLKPIQKDELEAAINKFRRLKGTENPNTDFDSLVRELQQKLQPKEYRKRFLVKQGQKLISIEIEEISYFFSDGRLNFFKTTDNRTFVVDYTMEELEEMLDNQKYFRISRSFYVSINSVDKIEDYFGNRLLLGLKPPVDKQALVSREKVTAFKKWMGK